MMQCSSNVTLVNGGAVHLGTWFVFGFSTTSQQPCKSSTDLRLLRVRKLANSEEASKLPKTILDNLEIHQRPFSFLAASAHGMGE